MNMRSLINFIENVVPDDMLVEAEIPVTSYGYWLDNMGKFHVVDRQNHYSVALSLGQTGYKSSYQAGWTRIVKENHRWGFMFDATVVGPRTISDLRRLYASEEPMPILFGDYIDDSSHRDGLGSKKFDKFSEFAMWFRDALETLKEPLLSDS